ncbi:unnamed protein product [Clonostachys solani]|uniref:Uncharacterized protein n=1 Tax=Clonostachys solani TaxID=160281 RepID=A0A9N9YZR2_9HYPO|nr:unnamed protein product [Clonostachys solani]
MLVIPSSGPTTDPSYPGKIPTELAVQAAKEDGGGCGHLLFLAVAHVVAVPRIANCLSQLTSHDFYPTSPPTRPSPRSHHLTAASGVELLGGVESVWLAAVPGHTHTNHQSTHQQSVTGEDQTHLVKGQKYTCLLHNCRIAHLACAHVPFLIGSSISALACSSSSDKQTGGPCGLGKPSTAEPNAK